MAPSKQRNVDVISLVNYPLLPYTVVLHLSGSSIVRIHLTLLVKVSSIQQISLALKLAVVRSSTVQCYDF